MPKRVIAVVGATGHIGQVLSEDLLRRGHEVRALGRDGAKLAALQAKGAEARAAAFDDVAAMSEAFRGASAVFAMVAPAYGEDDFSGWQDRSGGAIVKALTSSGVQHVVNLSSVGAQHPDGTGPIAGLHRQEKRLEGIAGLNVLHLRPSYFMENHYWSIPLIRSAGINGSSIRPDCAIAQVTTADIGRKAADLLDRLDFRGRTVIEFGGPKDLTLSEATSILGRAVGRPDLKYVQFPYEESLKGMIGSGMKPGIAALMVDMARGFNEGRVRPETAVMERGATSLEAFSRDFAAAFKAA